MPLHLLGKKSWNVYNPANIARVKRDEAEAQSRAEAEEKRQQELDAARRLAILRGETLPPPSPPPAPIAEEEAARTNRHKRDRDDDDEPRHHSFREPKKKRKRFGEDDTDFEMRVARERAVAVSSAGALGGGPAGNGKKTSNDAPIVDSRGHIALFPETEPSRRGSKNEDAEREAAKKRRELEDKYTMRFANAAGRDGTGVTGSGPWYAGSASGALAQTRGPGKDVWGNDDPNRKGRDAARISADDPLAMMKRGAAKARDVEEERRALNEERERELRQLRKEEKRREKRRRHRGEPDDELDGFMLDGQGVSNDRDRDRGRGHREHRSQSHRSKEDSREHRHRHSSHNDRPRDRSRDRSRHREDHPERSHHRSSRRLRDPEDGAECSPKREQREQRERTKTDRY
ncbi:hypothetical protein F5Y17DRAFT_108217 [Xylariaceae sp. FL0594]|nr:hypothetical protein F5Y17DRAFT_108217 [Xylariaceae sp. FL0594]